MLARIPGPCAMALSSLAATCSGALACSSSSSTFCAWPGMQQRTKGRTKELHVLFSQNRGKTDLVRSIRAMPIKLVRVSKDNSKAAQDMASEWTAKLARYTSVNEVVLKPNPKGASSPQVQKEAEAEKVLKAIAPGERVIILDERGKDATSEDIARLLIKASDDGTPLCFVIGGPFGHGPAVMQRAHESVRLSRMVMNHSVAYIVLVEQLYRAWTIVRGEPYHH